jgi:hypothetical protein
MPRFSDTGSWDSGAGGWKTPWMADRARSDGQLSGRRTRDFVATTVEDAAYARKRFELRRRRKLMLGPAAVAAFVFLMVGLHMGRPLQLGFPIAAVLVAGWLYWRSFPHYVSFTFWLYFLSPEVRRLSDYYNGVFSEQSLIIITPALAAAISIITLCRNLNVLVQRRALPFALILLGLLYGYLVGMLNAGLMAATYGLATWIIPIVLAFHLLVTWEQYPDYHRTILKTYVFGCLVMSIYGIVQYVGPPAWDAFWLTHCGMLTEGKPLPYQMRLASTMNSSGPFATTLMVCLLMSLAARNKLGMLASALAVPVLMGTLVRSAAGGFFVGLAYLFLFLDGRGKLRMLGAIVAVVALCWPVLTIDQVAKPTMKRFETIFNLKNDDSFQTRNDIYRVFTERVTSNIAGQGLGSVGIGSKLSDSDSGTSRLVDFDSGVLEVPLVLGWPGALLYVGGVALLVYRMLRANFTNRRDRFAVSGAAGALGVLSMMIFINTLTTVSGIFFFSGATGSVIAMRYANERLLSRRRRNAVPDREGPKAPGSEAARAIGGNMKYLG